MSETFAVIVTLYLVPVAALALTWRDSLNRAMSRILFTEGAALVVYFPLYALVAMVGWRLADWGSMTLADVLLFWQGDATHSALWIWLALGETALVLLVRWVIERVRRRVRQAEFDAVTQAKG